MPRKDDTGLRERLASQLGDCRQRGIERLYIHTAKQSPLSLPDLEQLAADYTAAQHLSAHGHIPQIKALLLGAIAAFERRNSEDAKLIRNLFFGEDTARIRRTAGDLLKRAQKLYGEPNRERFREIRGAVLQNFAEFLIEFARSSFLPPPSSVHDLALESNQRGAGNDPQLAAILQFSWVDPGGTENVTIKRHSDMIADRGYCWWGWFQAVHDDDYSEKIKQLKECDVGLWERSKNEYFVAHCHDVATNNGEPLLSPELAYTPEYYRSETFPAWFRLTSIRESSKEEFEERFGITPNSKSTIYWGPEPAPSLLSITAQGNSILHISDLHFGANHRWSTISTPRRKSSTAEGAIVKALQMRGVDLSSIAVVVISGNFTSDEPTREAYAEALGFVDNLCARLPNVEREHVVIVPGADDFGRPGDRAQASQRHYREFYQKMYGDPELDISQIRQYQSKDLRINVLPVNSVKELGTDQRDIGFFGRGYDTQLEVMQEDYLGDNKQNKQSRIVNVIVTHHHLISTPVALPEADSSGTTRIEMMRGISDAKEVMAKLSPMRISLFLHGHLNETSAYIVPSRDGWQTAVCGAGTAGARDGWLRSRHRDVPDNSLALYMIEQDKICGEIFALDGGFGQSPTISFELRDGPMWGDTIHSARYTDEANHI